MIEAEPLEVIFNSRREVIKILDTANLCSGLFNISAKGVCQVAHSISLYSKPIGKGSQGSVFVVEDESGDKKDMAMKKVSIKTEIRYVMDDDDTLGNISHQYGVNPRYIALFNEKIFIDPATDGLKKGIKNDTSLKKLKIGKILIPTFLKSCELFEDYWGSDLANTSLKKGDLIYPPTLSEIIIGIVLGELVKKGECINFVKTIGFAMCRNVERDGDHYIFMELCDGTLDSIFFSCYSYVAGTFKKEPSEKQIVSDYGFHFMIDSVILQVIFGVAFIQQDEYQILHGDLHGGNIFLCFIDKEVTWKGQYLRNADFYEYVVGKTHLYLNSQLCPFIAKIGDFGFASKMSPPFKIINSTMFKTLPRVFDSFNKTFDLTMFFTLLYKNHRTPFVRSIMEKCEGCLKNNILAYIDQFRDKPVKTKFKTSFTSAEDLLTDKTLMEPFLKRPPKGSKIITLGKI